MTDSTVFGSPLNWLDCLIVAAVVVLTLTTGICLGCFNKAPKTSEQYFLGNRQMFIVPVAFSLICSFVSGVTLVQLTEEIYFYGTQCMLLIIAFIPASLTLTYFYIPVYYNLHLSSCFEYFQLRFGRAVQITTSFVGIVNMVGYVTLVLFGSASALTELTSLNVHLLTMAILLLCILSTTLGGLRAVLWTGTIQAIVLIVSLSVLIGVGLSSVENLSIATVWNRTLSLHRVEFLNMDADPRVRHTFWTSIVGGYYLCLSILGGTQGQIQRFVSVSSLAKAKLAFFLSTSCLTLLMMLIFVTALLTISNYFNCDFNLAEIISTDHHYLLTKFAKRVFTNFPGVPGLVVSGILCCTLSTISNTLNSLVLTATHDYITHWIPNISEESLIFLSKALLIAFGSLAFGLAFVAENIEPFVPEIWYSLLVISAAIFGTFTLGMFFPWTNSKGALLGLIASLALTLYGISLRATVESRGMTFPDQKLSLPTFNCSTLGHDWPGNYSSVELENPYIPKLYSTTSLRWKSQSSHDIFIQRVLSISPMWYPALSWLVTIVFGLFFSLLFVKWERKWRVRPDCLSPPMLKLWFKCFPVHMKKWVEPDENLVLLCSNSFSVMPMESEDHRFSKEPLCEVKFRPIIQLARPDRKL